MQRTGLLSVTVRLEISHRSLLTTSLSSLRRYPSSRARVHHNPPPDILAYQRQHDAHSPRPAKYKVPQASTLRLGHFSTIWLNLFPSAFPSLLLSHSAGGKFITWYLYNSIYNIVCVCVRVCCRICSVIYAYTWTHKTLLCAVCRMHARYTSIILMKSWIVSDAVEQLQLLSSFGATLLWHLFYTFQPQKCGFDSEWFFAKGDSP